MIQIRLVVVGLNDVFVMRVGVDGALFVDVDRH